MSKTRSKESHKEPWRSWYGEENGLKTLEAKLSKMESDGLGICGCCAVVLLMKVFDGRSFFGM